MEADFLREYRIDMVTVIRRSLRDGGGMTLRRFLVLLAGLSGESSFRSWVRNTGDPVSNQKLSEWAEDGLVPVAYGEEPI